MQETDTDPSPTAKAKKITAYQTYKQSSVPLSKESASSKSSRDSQRSPLLQAPKLATKGSLYLQKPDVETENFQNSSAEISYVDGSGQHPLSPKNFESGKLNQNNGDLVHIDLVAKRATETEIQQVARNNGNADMSPQNKNAPNLNRQLLKQKTSEVKNEIKNKLDPQMTLGVQANDSSSSDSKAFQLASNIAASKNAALPKSKELPRASKPPPVLTTSISNGNNSNMRVQPLAAKTRRFGSSKHQPIAQIMEDGRVEFLMMVPEDDKATIYQQSEVNSPRVVTDHSQDRAISAVGHVKVETNTVSNRLKTQETSVDQTDSVLQALDLYATTTTGTAATSERRDGLHGLAGGQKHFIIQDDSLYGIDEKPLPLRKINREKMYQLKLMQLKQQSGINIQTPISSTFPTNLTTRNHQHSYQMNSTARGSGEPPQKIPNMAAHAGVKSKSSLIIDTRGKAALKQALRSPFRNNIGNQQFTQQSYTISYDHNVKNSKAVTSDPREQLQQRRLKNTKLKNNSKLLYSLSPTQTHLLSQRMTGSSGSIAMLATSFNKLPSVDASRVGPDSEMVKALFKMQSQTSNMQHAAQHGNTSVNELLQQVANLSAKRSLEKEKNQKLEKEADSCITKRRTPMMLNEQSTGVLPFQPALKKEVEQEEVGNQMIKEQAEALKDYIAIADNPLFLMQPSQVQRQSNQENYQVKIKAISSRVPSPTDDNNTVSGLGSEVDFPLRKEFKSLDLQEDGIQNLILMQKIADKLSQNLASSSNTAKSTLSKNQHQLQHQTAPMNASMRSEIDLQNVYHQSNLFQTKARRQSDDPTLRFRSTKNRNSKQYMSLYRSENRQNQHQFGKTRDSCFQRAQTNPSPPMQHLKQRALPNLNQSRQQQFINQESKKSHQKILSQEMSFGAINHRQLKGQHNTSMRQFENLTQEEQLKVLSMVQKAQQKPHPKRGLAFRNQQQRGNTLQPMTRDGDAAATAKFNSPSPGGQHTADGNYAQFPDLNELQRHINTPVMLDVTSPIKIPQAFNDTENRPSVMTIYQSSSPVKFPDASRMSSHSKMPSSPLKTAATNMSQIKTQQELVELPNEQQQQQSEVTPTSTRNQVAVKQHQATKTSVQHQNSNQNLYNKEIMVNQRKVLMKLQGAEARRKQHPTIAHQNHVPPQEEFVSIDPAQLAPTMMTAVGQFQKRTGSFNPFTIKKQSEPQQKPHDQSSTLPEVAQEAERRRRAIMQMQENLLRERRHEQLQQQQQKNVTQSSFFGQSAMTHAAAMIAGATSQRTSTKQSIQLPSKVALTSRLSNLGPSEQVASGGKMSILDDNQSTGYDINQIKPRTKKEVLLKYKQDMANTVKEQSRQHKEAIESLKRVQTTFSKKPAPSENSNILHEQHEETPPKQPQLVSNLSPKDTEELEAASLVYMSPEGANRSNELKSADLQQRMKRQELKGKLNGNINLLDANKAVNQDFINMQTFQQAHKTFQNQSYQLKQPGGFPVESVGDSTETYVDGHMGTLKLPREPNTIQTSIVLKVAPIGFDFISHDDDGSRSKLMREDPDDIEAGEESYFNRGADSPNLRGNLWKKQRPKFEEIERMDADSEGKRRHKELAKKEFAKRKASIKKQHLGMAALAMATDKPNLNASSMNRMGTLAGGAGGSIHESSQQMSKSKRKLKQQQKQSTTISGANYMPHEKQKMRKPSFMAEQNNEDIMNLLQQKQ